MKVLCVKKDELFATPIPEDVTSLVVNPSKLLLKQKTHFISKRKLNKDPSYLQIVTYIVLADKDTKDIFIFNTNTIENSKQVYEIGLRGHIEFNPSFMSSINNVITFEALRNMSLQLNTPVTGEYIQKLKDNLRRENYGVIYNTAKDKHQIVLTMFLLIDKKDIDESKFSKTNNGQWLQASSIEKLVDNNLIVLNNWSSSILSIISQMNT